MKNIQTKNIAGHANAVWFGLFIIWATHGRTDGRTDDACSTLPFVKDGIGLWANPLPGSVPFGKVITSVLGSEGAPLLHGARVARSDRIDKDKSDGCTVVD
jgi:hypothetical protein